MPLFVLRLMPGTLFKIKENELYFTAINNKNFVVEIILEKLFSKWLSIPILTLKNLCLKAGFYPVYYLTMNG